MDLILLVVWLFKPDMDDDNEMALREFPWQIPNSGPFHGKTWRTNEISISTACPLLYNPLYGNQPAY
jgi:hypothetical protein